MGSFFGGLWPSHLGSSLNGFVLIFCIGLAISYNLKEGNSKLLIVVQSLKKHIFVFAQDAFM